MDQENIMKHGPGFIIIILLFATLFAACSGSGGGGIVPGPSVTLTSIAISPATPVIAPGTTTQFSAIGTYSNNNRQNITTSVTWASSDTGIASVSNATGSQGFVLATLATGTTIITASSGGITGSTTLTNANVASITREWLM
jgi:hypothetical protein